MDIEKINNLIESGINDFHKSRLESLNKLKLTDVLKRKNLYLYKAKNIQTSEELIKSITDAYLSSQEETMFGGVLEQIAIGVAYLCWENNAQKSMADGIDLEITDDKNKTRYIISIKSGPNWSNKSQKQQMIEYFNLAKKRFITQNYKTDIKIIAINGCCYGKDNKQYKDKGDYYKLCGQAFWEFISDDSDFYLSIIEPLGYKAKERNEDFNIEYAKVINKFSREFLNTYFLDDGSIDWIKIVKLNSENKLKI
ncbi:MAG: hypothetical protein FWD71_01985 [Oscillospiraceae bacterium]|nr:hypothetical protein [Oscillospiraceae bacterium]